MKTILKLLMVGLLCGGCAPYSFAGIRNIQDNHKFIYNIVNAAGGHVSGQTVSVKIQRASDAYFYDFADSTFKSSSWTNKTTSLAEDSVNGLYYYTFDPPVSETTAQQYVFIIDNTDLTYADHQAEVIDYQKIAGAVWDETSVCESLTAKQCMSAIKNSTDGDKEGVDYTGIEKTIRAQR